MEAHQGVLKTSFIVLFLFWICVSVAKGDLSLANI